LIAWQDNVYSSILSLMQILALDVGTSTVKAAVLDAGAAKPTGPVARSNYALDHPTAEAAEVSVDRLWTAFTAAAREATRGISGIEGIGFSVFTPGLVLLDKTDRPLKPIWTDLDRRARPAARQVWADVGEEFVKTVGNRPLPGGISAIAYRQMLTGDPYLFHDVKWYLHINGWLGLRLTGERAFDPSNASATGLFGTLTDQRWSPRWCDYCNVDPACLPAVSDASATLGNVRAAVAVELGVPAGIPVKLGGSDVSSAVLAAGMAPGDILHILGSTQLLATLTERPQPSPQLLTRLLGVGGLFFQVAQNPVGIVALEWLRELCFRDQASEAFYGQTIPQARARPTRVTLDPPYLGGDRLEIESRRAAFRDLTLTTDRLELLAALLEAMARCQRQAIQHLGVTNPRRRFVTGGAVETLGEMLPECVGAVFVEDAELRGVARLFHPG
jgi:xylulokinase